MDVNNEKLKEITQTSNWIIIPMLLAGWILGIYISDHVDNLRLINHHETTQGVVIEVKEDAEKGDDGQMRFDWDATYKFVTAEGVSL